MIDIHRGIFELKDKSADQVVNRIQPQRLMRHQLFQIGLESYSEPLLVFFAGYKNEVISGGLVDGKAIEIDLKLMRAEIL